MDDRRFDRLTIILSGAAGSRREALPFVATGLMALLGFAGGDETTEARKKDDKKDRKQKRRDRRRRKKKKRCNRTDNQCNLNRPSECCSKKCCFDSTSKSNGTCPSKGGECCGDRPFGGYCPVEFPQCCGSNACCGSSQTCCVNIGGRGVCCNPGFVCTDDGSGCVAAQGVEITEATAQGGIARMHGGV